MYDSFKTIRCPQKGFFSCCNLGVEAEVPEAEVQPEKEGTKNGITLDTAVVNETQSEEKMETNEATAPMVQENVNTEENIENSNAEQATDVTTEPMPEDGTKPSQEEVKPAVNEQELRYWSAVEENPQDFTSWTYLLQFVEQEVRKHLRCPSPP